MKSKGIKKKSLFERFTSQRSIQIDRAKGTRKRPRRADKLHGGAHGDASIYVEPNSETVGVH